MKGIDASDALIAAGVLIALAGLYFLLWPLPLIAIGAGITYVGLRRS